MTEARAVENIKFYHPMHGHSFILLKIPYSWYNYSTTSIVSTRHRASTSMYSLTFRVRVTTPRSMDEIEWCTQQARQFYRRRGESSPACVVRGTACGGPGGLLLGSATHF